MRPDVDRLPAAREAPVRPDVDRLPPAVRPLALALARALLPPGRRFAGADERTIDRLEIVLRAFTPGFLPRYATLLRLLEHAPRLTHRGRPFSRLSPDEAERFLDAWTDGTSPRRTLAFALTAPLKMAHFDDPDMFRALGCTWRFDNAGEPSPVARDVVRGADAAGDDEIECDAVIVGTGAGGAVVARELAEGGHAVVLIEEGEFHTRRDFTGRPIDTMPRFYRGRGMTGSLGNTIIPIMQGRTVGGSTTVNGGTCWRTPDWILHCWSRDLGLSDLAPDRMAPHFERVEREIGVSEADLRHQRAVAGVVARGCEALGYSHRPLLRNAPDCDGAGVCHLGCPTDAKRSTNVSYVPAALRRGARLYVGFRAERVLVEGGRIAGLEARALATGRRLRVRAPATILACGTLNTPVMLMRQGLGRALPHVGRNLSIHPATLVSAVFDEEIRAYAGIPQGYGVDEFHRDGILLMSQSFPIDEAAGQMRFVGRKLVEAMESFERVASLGVMVEDESRGRVVLGPRGRPFVFYWVGRAERERLTRGVAAAARIFLAAGAREVWPAVRGHRVVRDARDLARLESSLPAAADFTLASLHPLGTCRMARSPRDGVVSPDHEVFGWPGLYVVDGSVVPTAPGVNPQVTVMALATRAAGRIAERLDAAARAA